MLQFCTAQRTPLSHICAILSIFICVPICSSQTVPKTLENRPNLQSPSPLALVPYYHLVPAPHAFMLCPQGSGSGYSKHPASPHCAVHPGQWGGWSFPLQTLRLLTIAQMMTSGSVRQGETRGKCEGRGKMGWTVTVWL